MATYDVSPTTQKPTHHGLLSTPDGLTKVGLIFADAKTNPTLYGLERTPLRRTGAKISQGEGDYGDLEPPFAEVQQADWSGGMGKIDLDDRRRYRQGRNLETSFTGRAFIGPLPHFGSGAETPWRADVGGLFGSQQFIAATGNNARIARDFTPPASFTTERIYVLAKSIEPDRPGGPITVYLRADNAGVPGTVLATATTTAMTSRSERTILLSRVYTAKWGSPVALTGGTKYWVEVQGISTRVGVAGLLTYDTFGDIGTQNLDGRKPDVRYTNATISGVAAPLWLDLGSASGNFSVGGLDLSPADPHAVGFDLDGATDTFAVIASGFADVFVKADVRWRVSGRAGLALRFVDTSNWVVAYTDGSNIKLRKNVAGVQAEVGTAAFAWVNGATHNLSVRCKGSTFVVAVDGADLITGTIAELATNTSQGLYVRDGVPLTPAEWRKFSVAPAGSLRSVNSPQTWIVAEHDLRFRLVDAPDDFMGLLYEYKGAEYFVTNPDDAAAPRLFINGDRGVATGAQTSLTLQDTTKTWVVDEHKGGIVKIPGGTGKGQWAEIVSNTATTLSILGTWRTTPVTLVTQYCIVRVPSWREITGHGLTTPVTDLLVGSKGIVYFAQGDGTNLRRTREYVNAGVWTREYADDGANKAIFLVEYGHQDNGPTIMGSMDVDANGDASVAEDKARAWGTNLTWTTRIVCGRSDETINGLDRAGAPEHPWVFKEGTAGEVVNGVFSEIPLREMAAVRSQSTGAVHLVHNLYLHLKLGRMGWQRYYQSRLDGIGPDLDDGVPADMQGETSHSIGYPGRQFLSTGARGNEWPTDKYAVIFKYNGGWHPWYVHALQGVPIRRMHIQTIPGPSPDWMWVSAGSDLFYLPLPSATLDPTQDETMEYYHEGLLELSFNYFTYRDAIKFFQKLKAFTERCLPDVRFLTGGYDVDDNTGFHDFIDTVDEGPVERFRIRSADDHQKGYVQGRRLSVKIIFNTLSANDTPILRALVHTGVQFLETRNRYDAKNGLLLEDGQLDLNSQPDAYITVAAKLAQLQSWLDQRQVLIFSSVWSPYHNRAVSLDPNALKPLQKILDDTTKREKILASFGLLEVADE